MAKRMTVVERIIADLDAKIAKIETDVILPPRRRIVYAQAQLRFVSLKPPVYIEIKQIALTLDGQ